MGFIRGILTVLATSVFFFAALSSALFYTVGSSLDYAAVENKTVDLVSEISNQINLTQKLTSQLTIIKSYCKTGSEFNFSYQEYNFTVPCSGINQSVSGIVNDTIRGLIRNLYYEEYDCVLWDCFDKYPPTFLISAQSQAYWYKLFYFALTGLILSAAALFFLIEKKRHVPFVTGGLILLASLIILAINKAVNAVSTEIIAEIIGVFFSRASFVFFRMIFISAAILLAGLFIEFYRVGFKVYNLFSKLEKEKKDKTEKLEKKEK